MVSGPYHKLWLWPPSLIWFDPRHLAIIRFRGDRWVSYRPVRFGSLVITRGCRWLLFAERTLRWLQYYSESAGKHPGVFLQSDGECWTTISSWQTAAYHGYLVRLQAAAHRSNTSVSGGIGCQQRTSGDVTSHHFDLVDFPMVIPGDPRLSCSRYLSEAPRQVVIRYSTCSVRPVIYPFACRCRTKDPVRLLYRTDGSY